MWSFLAALCMYVYVPLLCVCVCVCVCVCWCVCVCVGVHSISVQDGWRVFVHVGLMWDTCASVTGFVTTFV